LRGPDCGRLTYLRALGAHRSSCGFSIFCSIRIRNRHKLIIAQERRKDPRSQLKAAKDRDQAAALITILFEDRPDDLIDVWRDLVDRGASWRARSERGVALLPEPHRGRFLREAAR
jgi:hypothetical protein